MVVRKPEHRQSQHKVIFLHKNAPSYNAQAVRYILETLSWEVLPQAIYSPDLAPSDYHLLTSMDHALAEQSFGTYEDLKNSLVNGSQQNTKIFSGVIFTNCPKKKKNCVTNDGTYIKESIFYHSSEFNMFFLRKNLRFILVHLVIQYFCLLQL